VFDDRLGQILTAVAPREPSRLSAHEAPCCAIAKGWFSAMAASATCQGAGPLVWIRERWQWGPTDWPLHWCRAVRAGRLDCGALAALGREAIRAAGLNALAVQVIERFNPTATGHWRRRWDKVEGVGQWLWHDFSYHEVVGISRAETLTVWDPTDNRSVDGKATEGYGSVVAIRVLWEQEDRPPTVPTKLTWHGKQLALNRWVRVGE
jgi:hypothetical protein